MINYDPRRWTRSLLAIDGTVTRRILGRVAVVALWSAAVVWVHTSVRPVGIPVTAHTLVGLAVGLLLVFRTNSSYERFWEGRKLWGSIVNDSRNLARTTVAFVDSRSPQVEAIVHWAIAFSYAAMHSLRGQRSLGPAADRLPAADVADVVAAVHVPSAVAFRISRLLNDVRGAGHLSDYVAMTIEADVQRLLDSLGACERIRQTPIPFAYVVHLRTALLVFAISLPFALVETFGWSTALCAAIIAFVLLGIEEIGVEIENPFGTDRNDLPLEQICATIDANLKAVLDSQGARLGPVARG